MKILILIIIFFYCDPSVFASRTNIDNFYQGNFVLRCYYGTEEMEKNNEWKNEEFIVDDMGGHWDFSTYGENFVFPNHTLNGKLLYYRIHDPNKRKITLYDPLNSWEEEVTFQKK